VLRVMGRLSAGGVPPGRAGDGGRAGLLTDEGRMDQDRLFCTLACWRGGLSSISAKPLDKPPERESLPADIILASDFSQITKRHQERAEGEAPKQLFEKSPSRNRRPTIRRPRSSTTARDRAAGRKARTADARPVKRSSRSHRRRSLQTQPPEPKQAYAKT